AGRVRHRPHRRRPDDAPARRGAGPAPRRPAARPRLHPRRQQAAPADAPPGLARGVRDRRCRPAAPAQRAGLRALPGGPPARARAVRRRARRRRSHPARVPRRRAGGADVSDPLRLVVLGMMGRAPFGGQTWLYLNWLRALDRLGHEVWYVEDDIVWAYDPRRNAITDDFFYAVAHVRQAMESIGLGDRWAFRFALEPRICAGLAERELDALYRSCDALLNVVGATELREAHLAAPYRVYVETDPVTVELKYAAGIPT